MHICLVLLVAAASAVVSSILTSLWITNPLQDTKKKGGNVLETTPIRDTNPEVYVELPIRNAKGQVGYKFCTRYINTVGNRIGTSCKTVSEIVFFDNGPPPNNIGSFWVPATQNVPLNQFVKIIAPKAHVVYEPAKPESVLVKAK